MSYQAPPPPPPPPPPGAGPPAWQPAPQASSKATTSLVLGILGLVVCGPLGIAAIVVGRQAQTEIAQAGGALSGEGLAKAGIIMGWVEVALMVVGLLFLVLLLAGGAFSMM